MSKWKVSNGGSTTFAVSPMDENDQKTLDRGVTISIAAGSVYDTKEIGAAQAKLFAKAFGEKWEPALDKWLDVYGSKVGIEKVK